MQRRKSRLEKQEKELLKIIEEAARDGRTYLYLDDQRIKSLPTEIGQLTNLTKLRLYKNQLTSVPKELGQLKNLNWLDLSNNQLTSVPKELGQLKNLEVLSLGGNQLASVPKELGQLKNLNGLDLSNNQLTSVPAELGKLTKLTGLNLSSNQLTSVPKELGQLKNLITLYLVQNQLRSLPKEIVDWGMEIKWRGKSRKGILLEGNPLESPPIEIVKQNIKAIKNYFISVETETVSRVYEAKLLIVGEGKVGKTCLMKRLMEPNKEINKNEITTEGIEIKQWMIETQRAKDFRVNFWDFGGQEIYHATHQFFLTKRSLYLFVWVARTDDDLTSFDYWLNVVRILSDNSPVIVVLNKIDERTKTIDEQSLQDKFENIKCFERVSALQGKGIENLISDIREQITNLPHIGDILPTAWIDIRKRLEGLNKNYISIQQYKAICKKSGLDEERAEFLSQYYHDLGVFLHFMDDTVLREIIFLKPDWATNAVYKVVDTKEIQENYGKFHFEQLKDIWRDYPEDKFVHLLELMKKFELCFQVPKTQTYIVPELLRPGKPEFEWNYADNLRFEYRYEFMPAGIIARFIVRTHDICKEQIYWKNGVILKREKTEVIIVSERLHRKIRIWISGKKRKELLAIIRREIDYIHKTLNYPDVKEMIPCICRRCARVEQPYFYDYETLCRFRAKGKIACEKSTEDVSIEKLLGEYERPEGKREMGHYQEKYPKWYKTFWVIIIGVIALLGGIWTTIQIYEWATSKNTEQKTSDQTKIEKKQEQNTAAEDESNEIRPQ